MTRLGDRCSPGRTWVLAVLILSGCVGRVARFDDEESNAGSSYAEPAAPLLSGHSAIARDRLVAFIRWRNRGLGLAAADRLADDLQSDCALEAVDERLVAAIVAVESSFDAHALSSSGAAGLGQLIPSTARDMGVTDPFDPEQNLRGTSRYLAWLVSQWPGRADLAIASYATGIKTVRKQMAAHEPLRPDQILYVRRVLGLFAKLS